MIRVACFVAFIYFQFMSIIYGEEYLRENSSMETEVLIMSFYNISLFLLLILHIMFK